MKRTPYMFFKDIKYMALENGISDIYPVEDIDAIELNRQYEQSLYYIVKHLDIHTERGDFKLYLTDRAGKTVVSMYIGEYAILTNPVMTEFAKNVYITAISIDNDDRPNSVETKIISLSGIYCAEKHTDNRYANYLYNKICEEYERLSDKKCDDSTSNEQATESVDI